MQIKLHSIVWDTDGKDVNPPLPTDVWVYDHSFPNGHILTEEEVNELTDDLSEEIGWPIQTLDYTCYDSD